MVKNSKKIILDLCGGTGSWSLPYRENEYDVRNITLPDYDIFEWNEYIELCPEIYGILAAPPCAHFSLARNMIEKRAKVKRDIPENFKAVTRCREIIEHCAIYGKLKFWALENPKGLLRQILGKPVLTFEAWEYGDPWKKATDLWGFYNLPKKTPVKLNGYTEQYFLDEFYRETEIPADHKRVKGDCIKSIKRAMTPPNFAEAFYRANR